MLVIGKALSFHPVEDARRAESLGYDGVRAVDHYFSAIPPAQPVAVPHCFVGLTAAAMATERVLLTQTMVAASLHHPFEVAQAVAALDRISGGRAELGLGTGWLAIEHESMGRSLGSPAERLARAVEAATVCRDMFDHDGRVHFDGEFFRAHSDATWPATPHRPQIMMGAHGPRLIRAAATVADRVDLLEALASGQPDFSGSHANTADNLAVRRDLARATAAEHGRSLVFSATVNLLVSPTTAARDDARRTLAAPAGCDPGVLDDELLRLIATEDEVLGKLAQLAALGIDRLHIRPMDDHTQTWLDNAVTRIQEL